MHTKSLLSVLAPPILIATTLLATPSSPAQEKASPSRSYDVSRETTLVGTVLTYSSSSKSAPLGPRITVQTSAGVIDVHLGDARFLAARRFTIQPGDTVRIIGEDITFGGSTEFMARIVQKGTLALTVRTTKGFPITNTNPRAEPSAAKPGSAL